MSGRWDDDVEQLRVLEQRRVWLELSVEKHGDDRGHKLREAAAIAHVLDMVAAGGSAHDVAEARELVARRPPLVK